MSYNYLTEVPVNNNASSTVRALSVDHPDNQFLEGFRLEVGLHELEDLMDEVIIRFDTNPSNYLKDDYLHLIALIIKEFDRLSSLHEKVSILESTDVDIKGNIESNLDRIEEVRGLVINLNTDLRSINNTIRVINNNIDALQAKDSIFTKSIEDINTSILKHIEDYSKEIKGINTTIELLNTNIDTIDSNIEKLFNRKVSEGASIENYVSLSVESDVDDNTIITLDDTLLKLELDTVDNNISNINTKITEISNVLGKVYKVKGSTTVDNINSMTVDTAMIGHVYNLLDSGVITNGIEGELEVVKGNNIVYTEDGWDEFAVSLDLDLDQCAGLNISIEGNVISAKGYVYNEEKNSFATGSTYTTASGWVSHAEGSNTKAIGNYSHAEGGNTEAKGAWSHAEGSVTVTNNENEHAQGCYNVSNKYSDDFGDERNTIHSIGIGISPTVKKNAQEVMQNGDHYIVGVGGYDGTNATDEEVKTLQEVIEDISSASGGGETYTAGDNISIENGTISTLGYEFDNELNSVKVGRKLTTEELEEIFGESAATLAAGNTSTLTAWENGTFSWVKDTNIIQVTDTSVSLPGIIFKVTTNDDSILCCIVDRDLPNNQLIVDKDIPFDYIENVSTLDMVIGIAYGKASIAGQATVASGNMAHSEGFDTFAHGMSSHSEGIMNWSLGAGSHVEGIGSVAYTASAHAEGYTTKAYGGGSHTEGGLTVAEGDYSHAEGFGTQTKHEAEHAEGFYNLSNTGTNEDTRTTLHSIGVGTSDNRKNAHEVMDNGDTFIVGIGDYDGTNPYEAKTLQLVISDLESVEPVTYTAGNNISIENDIISAVGYKYDKEKESFSIGSGSATGQGSYAEGSKTIASGQNSHAEGVLTKAEGHASHAEGTSTKATRTSHAEGGSTEATGNYSHSEGYQTKASGEGSHAEGSISEALGSDSHAEGFRTMTNNKYEHAQGCHNISNKNSDEFGDAGNTIHSIGIGSWTERKNAQEVMQNGDYYILGVGDYNGTTIEGASSVLSVINTLIDTDIPAINQRIDNLNIPSDFSNVVTKTENYQITLGTDNNATHEKTLLVGTGLATSNNEALVVGAYNNSEYFVNWGVDAPAIQVGAGSEDSKRTVMVIKKNGKSLGLLGFEQNGFGDFAEYFEWADGNPEGEDRVGYMVLLNEDKIELAESLDNCIGIITGTGAFVADAACLDWHGRYLKDKWGRNIYALTGVLAENPEYDPTKEYTPREYRKEWSPVGLVGKILVRQDGTLKPNGFVGCVNGIATNVDKSSWRVLKVINEEIALVLIK